VKCSRKTAAGRNRHRRWEIQMVSFFRKAGLSVLLRNGVCGGRIPLLTPRDLLRKEKPLRNQLQIMGKL
jgi:hypothetical protein